MRTVGLVGLGDAEQHADDPHRHLGAEVGDEVEAVGPDERVEARTAVRPHLVLERVHRRGVNTRDISPRCIVCSGGSSNSTTPDGSSMPDWMISRMSLRTAGERLPVDERLLDVGVPRQRPDVVALVVVDRRLVAEPRNVG